jgi:hypothetical protein
MREDSPTDDEVYQAKRYYLEAMEAWRALVKYAGDISEFDLPEFQGYYFQAKEARLAVARLAGDPSGCGLHQAKAYYREAQKVWQEASEKARIRLDHLASKDRMEEGEADVLLQLIEHARKREKSIDKAVETGPPELEVELPNRI